MVKIYFSILGFLFLTFVGRSQVFDYILKKNGEKMYGDIKAVILKYKKPSTYKIKLPTGEKMKFTGADYNKIYFDSSEYVSLPIQPEKSNNIEKDFMKVILQHNYCTIYSKKFYYTGSGGMGKHVGYIYYLYCEDKFIDYLDHKNFKGLILKHIDCERLVREVQHNRKIRLEHTFNIFNEYCKNE